jgi:hypothetical protein
VKYFIITVKHKWFVFLAGIKVKANIWDLITHDLSKFSLAEIPHYQRQFFGKADQPLQFSYAWNHHQKCNKHHWEYWVPITGHTRGGYGDMQALPIPERYIREMIADWMGAGRAYEGKYPNPSEWKWLNSNKDKIFSHCHQDTVNLINKIIFGDGRS